MWLRRPITPADLWQTVSCDDDSKARFAVSCGRTAQDRFKLHTSNIHRVIRIGQGGTVQRGCGERRAFLLQTNCGPTHARAHCHDMRCMCVAGAATWAHVAVSQTLKKEKVVDEKWSERLLSPMMKDTSGASSRVEIEAFKSNTITHKSKIACYAGFEWIPTNCISVKRSESRNRCSEELQDL